ncbi:MAG: N-acetylmuramoyl-L-alanine amidase [Chloroflexota bacterium]
MSSRGRPEDDPGQAAPPARETMRYLGITFTVAAILATVFTAWTPASLSPGEVVERLVSLISGQAGAETPVADFGLGQGLARRVGVVVGHAGPNRDSGMQDPGSVCPDGLTELDVNRSIAERVAQGLNAVGVQVDLLDEWDARLAEYRALALVSIHADACVWINDQATGYKVSGALDTAIPDRTQRLVDCIADRYGRVTGLAFHAGSITRDMTEYHSFYEIHSQTPAAIIETGFLYLDRDFLTQHPDVAAQGIIDGVLCYLNNEPAFLPGAATP